MPDSTQTEWVIITGAPCSGKTTIIELLEKKGYQTSPEVARDYIQSLIEKKSNPVDRAKIDVQRTILRIKQQRENTLEPHQRIYFDRGLPDSIAYYKNAKLNFSEALQACKKFRYKKVFVFDRLPLVQDEVRKEDEVLAERLDHYIRTAYELAGYEYITVPAMSIHERLAFVLAHS